MVCREAHSSTTVQ